MANDLEIIKRLEKEIGEGLKKEGKTTSRRKRKLMPPARPSRIPEKVIIKAIEEVMAQRSSH